MAKFDTGAVQSKTSFGDKSRSYWAHHRSTFFGSLVRLMATPGQTLMTSLVVAIALALPMTLLLALGNIQQLGDNWDASPKISVYLNLRARDTAIQLLVEKLKLMPEINAVEYLSADAVLADFQRLSGFGEALEALEDNPLPATLIITPAVVAVEPAQLKLLGERITAEAIVDEVSMDMEWIRRLRELMVLGKKIVAALAGLLGLGVLLAVGNTIRLAIENRREEIIVSKLVGGTNGFVRRPFLYSGGWYGFFGGVLASLIVALGFWIIDDTAGRLASLYQSDFQLQALGAKGGLQLLAAGTLLGWLGAWLAVGRHLAQIEPR
ncbi:permease-like cell division protein FtsX [Teredinibacter franksiae]|uniref:permease-like cell division protein FtsX n=1 Tax=Teredinibacter franksiae TaxID=2761453 RepID=UPI0016268BE6|nr:permease-like cell division protein FtsX [Teredinibacter franksiae]